MPEIIEFEDGIARIITKTISRQVPISELLKNVERVPEIILPTLPRSAVFSSWYQRSGETRMNILCELPPASRAITKNIKRNYPRGLRRYRLSMPWTYFWFTASTSDRDASSTVNWGVGDAKVFHAREQYQDINSPMIVARLPNLSSDGAICYGTTSVPIRQSLANQLDQRVNEWYLTEFNDDLDRQVPLPYGESNLLRWVTESRENPNSWRDWPEFSDTNSRVTVKQLMAYSGVELPITERFMAGGFIPPADLPYTYGAWEDWWRTIPAEERRRGLRAVENIMADNPADVPEEAPAPLDSSVTDDGGIPVT